jgi:hypothetical protein
VSVSFLTNVPFTLSFTDKDNRTITTKEPCPVCDSIIEDCILGIRWCRKTLLALDWNSNQNEFTDQMNSQKKGIKILQEENILKELQHYQKFFNQTPPLPPSSAHIFIILIVD